MRFSCTLSLAIAALVLAATSPAFAAATPVDGVASVALQRRQFSGSSFVTSNGNTFGSPTGSMFTSAPLVTNSIANSINGMVASAGAATIGGISTNSFYANEVFALYNAYKGECLAVQNRGRHQTLRLVTEDCNLSQTLQPSSRLAFFWVPSSDNNLAYLGIMVNGNQLCARHETIYTRFYPCDAHSTEYSLGASDDDGMIQVHDANKSSSCLVAEVAYNADMMLCGPYPDQAWEKIHIAYTT
jgi:hypothetical protein